MDFDIPVGKTGDVYDRYLVRMEEMKQSNRIISQCVQWLKANPGPVITDNHKVAAPSRESMKTNMEGLIHHFKIVTEGFRVPAGQAYTAVESPRGELGVHMVSDGGTRPYRVHYRDPSFTNLQAVAAMCEGGMVADVIASVASIDPVMGGVDR
jgi:NADH-quinone oxidoreductase subunit D